MQMNPVRYTVLYDGECRICTAFARAVQALGVTGHVRSRPIQESLDMLGPMPPGKVLDSMHAIAPDGRVTTGGEAMPAIVAAVAGGPALESLLRSSALVKSSLGGLYRVMVTIRGRLTCGIASPSSAQALPP